MLEGSAMETTVRVAVMGLGYVGLPLAHLCWRRGLEVVGLDSDADRVARLRRAESTTPDVSPAELETALRSGTLVLTDEPGRLARSRVIVICVPTGYSYGEPDYFHLAAATQTVAGNLSPGSLIIVESTVGPGATTRFVLPRLRASGLREGRGFYLAYSPERTDPGNKTYRLPEIPRLVAGLTPACREGASAFYARLGVPIVPVSSLLVAEVAKVFENTYRDVNVALVNELAGLCRRTGLSAGEVLAAAATKPFGFQAFQPGPGVGGHCVPVGNLYFSAWAREAGLAAALAESARRVNEARPREVVAGVREVLSERGRDLSGARVLVLGVTYKRNVPDTRLSPAVRLVELLHGAGARVAYHDPYVPELEVGGLRLTRRPPVGAVPEESGDDVTILAVGHDEYASGRWPVSSPVLVDLTGSAGRESPLGVEVVEL